MKPTETREIIKAPMLTNPSAMPREEVDAYYQMRERIAKDAAEIEKLQAELKKMTDMWAEAASRNVAQKLGETYSYPDSVARGWHSALEAERAKNAKLREALGFYANETHWVARQGGGGLRVTGFDCEDNEMIWGFSGRRARQALKESGQ